mgnify:CR=1 FL=1
MALKVDNKDNLDYLNKLLEDNGLEIILPDLNSKKEEEKKDTKDSNNNEK